MEELVVTVVAIVLGALAVFGLIHWGFVSECWVPFCKFERRYRKVGSGGEWRCIHTSTWRHRGRHLVCTKCRGDYT